MMRWSMIACCLVLAGGYFPAANAQDALSRPVGTNQPGPTQTRQLGGIQRPANSAPVAEQQAITPRRESNPAERPTQAVKDPFSLWRMIGALILVVAGMLGLAKLVKALGLNPFQAIKPLPPSVYEILGTVALPPRHSLYLVRMGQRLLVLSATGDSLTVLSEITDAHEVASLSQLCASSAATESEEGTFWSRLIQQATAAEANDPPVAASAPNAREALEARLNALTQT